MRFLEEDRQEFGIDCLVAGLGKFQRLRRRRRGLDRRPNQRRDGGVDLGPQGVSSLQRLEDGLRGVAQFGIRQQVGVLLQGLQIVLQLGANAFVARGVLECLEQGLGLVHMLFELNLDARYGRQILPGDFRCLGLRCALQPPQEDIEIAFAMLQCIDEETEGRKLLGHGFEVAGQWRIIGTGEFLDLRSATLRQRNGRHVAQHGQRAADLPHRRIECRKILFLLRIPEKGVERLFHLGQIALDLARHLPDQQLFLSPAGHLVEQRQIFVAANRIAGDTGVQAGDHEVHLLREVHPQATEILLGILQQQDDRRHLHRYGVIVAGG